MDKRTLHTLLILLIVIGISTGLFFTFFEKAERTVFSPGSAKARQNPFLAAVRFLDRSKMPAEGSNQRDFLNQLPPVRELIFIHRPGSNTPEERISRIAAWVERGGTLVIHHDLAGREETPLLDALGLRFKDVDPKTETQGRARAKTPDSKGRAEAKKEAEKDIDKEAGEEESREEEGGKEQAREKEACRCPEKETLEDFFRGEKMQLEFRSNRALPPLDPSSSAIELFRGKAGAHLVHKSVGEGQLIVISDDRLLTNKKIGKHDHAFFLLLLSQGRDKVWILYNAVMPSIFSLVLKKMPLLVFSFLVLAVFCFLYLTRRIGPVYPVRDFSSRNIIEHLLAAGHFVRKKEKTYGQIKRSRKALEKKIAARYLYFAKKPRSEQIRLISKWAQMPAADVLAALEHPVTTTQGYIHTTMGIKKIQDTMAANHKQTER